MSILFVEVASHKRSRLSREWVPVDTGQKKKKKKQNKKKVIRKIAINAKV